LVGELSSLRATQLTRDGFDLSPWISPIHGNHVLYSYTLHHNLDESPRYGPGQTSYVSQATT